MGCLLSLCCPPKPASRTHSIEVCTLQSHRLLSEPHSVLPPTVKPPVEPKSTIPSLPDPETPPAMGHINPISTPSPSSETGHAVVNQPPKGRLTLSVKPTVTIEDPLSMIPSLPDSETPPALNHRNPIPTQLPCSTIEQPDAPPPAYTPSSHEMPKPQTSDPRLDPTLVNPANGQSRAPAKLQVVNPDDAPSVPLARAGVCSSPPYCSPVIVVPPTGPKFLPPKSVDAQDQIPQPTPSAQVTPFDLYNSPEDPALIGKPDPVSPRSNFHRRLQTFVLSIKQIAPSHTGGSPSAGGSAPARIGPDVAIDPVTSPTATPKPPVPSQPTRRILPSTNDKLRLRVLVVGRAGVGKSSLISYAFGVGKEADITQPITPPENDRFILHDSMGFEHGASEEFNIAKDFLESRSGNKVALEEQVHEGDQAFLKLAAEISVPIVVVFTQFDVLVMRATPASALAQAESAFQDLCTEPLQTMSKGFRIPIRYQRMSGLDGTNPDAEALAQLIEKITIHCGTASRCQGEAQHLFRVEYWKYVAASAEVTVSNWTIAECLNTLHQKIVTSWNIYDPNEASNLSLPDVDFIHHWIGLAVPVAAFSGPAAVAVVLSAEFVKWITRVNQRKPETLRCFMAYIIDLTLVLEHAFGLVHLKPTPVALDRDMLDVAVQGYRNLLHGRYASEVGIFEKDRLQKKMRELICNEAQGKK
ncbi:hypothetical protein DFH09DRAFT_1125264 [Mycena vulgaris]|nr:hypothetical protein DFH09DRAFT_1125264 [Mycena vulgaris]